MKTELYENLLLDLKYKEIFYVENYSLKTVSSFKIGGKALVAAFPESREKLIKLIHFLYYNDISFEIVGNCTNILFDDNGYDGVIVFTEKLMNCSINGTQIFADAGISLTTLCRTAYKSSLGGCEFLFGIPGYLGGALFMNAGAFGHSISEIVDCVDLYDYDKNRLLHLSAEEMDYGYRHSIAMNRHYVILGAVLNLEKGDSAKIETTMLDYSKNRREKQPLEFPSAGSVFKRPEGYFAGKLIEDCGLKGYSVGDAVVSTKHAGFIVNKGNAKSEDVIQLIGHIKETVKEKFGIELECEIRFIKQ